MALIGSIADEGWEEVRFINGYAYYVGSLSLLNRGFSILMVSWTTVVLLGGFVSMLGKKDFWCLTVILVAQTPGVFKFSAKENKNITSSPEWTGLKVELYAPANRRWHAIVCALPRATAICLGEIVFSTLFTIILIALMVLYLFGVYISTGISLWRLIQHNYGVAAGDASKANLNPGLYLLYSLAVLQGLLFCYMNITVAVAEGMVSRRVAMAYGFGDAERRLVASYAQETRDGCASTGLSFIGGRNLVTCAVELLESKPPDSYASGVRLLDALLRRQRQQVDDDPRRREILLGQHALVKHLLLAGAGAGHVIIQRLLHTLDSRSPYGRETRGCAAKIVAHIAGGISLERFPGGMQCIASLLGTFQEYSSMEPLQRDWLLEAHEPECLHEAYDQVCSDALSQKKPRDPIEELELTFDRITKRKRRDVPVDCDDDMGYRDLVLQGMRILRKLAANEDNCKIISNTPGLLSKIMAPLTSDLLHNSSHAHAHAEWPSDVVEGSLRVMLQLATPSAEAGTNLRRAISADRQAVTTMHNIVRCRECQAKEYCLAALKILTQLCLDDESCHLGTESKEDFIKILLHKFVIDDEDNSIRPRTRLQNQQGSIRKLAGEALEMLSDRSECNAATILKANDTVVDDLSKILLDGQSTTYRKSAAQILDNLCRQYSEDDECLRKLKEAMTVAMPKVLTEILSCNLIGQEPPASAVGFPNRHSDIESQHTHVSQTNFEQHKDRKLQAALLSLSVTVCNTFVSADQSLVRAIAPADHDASNFAKKLAEMLKRIGDSMDDRREMQELRKLVKQNTNSDDDRLRILELREIVRRKKDSMNDYLEMLKLTSTMVISMMKHRDSYDYEQQDLESLVKSLSTIASGKLLTPDCSMVFASGHHGAMPRNPRRTLGSLVKEAEELLDKIKGPELAVVPASSAEGNLVEIS